MNRILSYLMLAAFVLVMAIVVASAANIYDKHEGYQGRVDERGNVYDKREKYIGRIEKC